MSTNKSLDLTYQDIKDLLDELEKIPLLFETKMEIERVARLRRKLKRLRKFKRNKTKQLQTENEPNGHDDK